MSTPTLSLPIRRITKLNNFNNVLNQEYFGQVDKWTKNWQNLIGEETIVDHPDVEAETKCRLIKICLFQFGELKEFDGLGIFINQDLVLNPRTLCGFDEKTYNDLHFLRGYDYEEAIGLYIFKNLNFQA